MMRQNQKIQSPACPEIAQVLAVRRHEVVVGVAAAAEAEAGVVEAFKYCCQKALAFIISGVQVTWRA